MASYVFIKVSKIRKVYVPVLLATGFAIAFVEGFVLFLVNFGAVHTDGFAIQLVPDIIMQNPNPLIRIYGMLPLLCFLNTSVLMVLYAIIAKLLFVFSKKEVKRDPKKVNRFPRTDRVILCRKTLKLFKILILSFLTSLVFMNYLIYIIFPRLSFYEFGGFLAAISLIGLIFLSMEVENKKSALPFAISLSLCLFNISLQVFPRYFFPTHDSFVVFESALLSVLMISALIFLRNNIEVGKTAVTGFFVFIPLYSALKLIPSAYDVLFKEHHLIR